ncbi:hypothetical protein JB92DRAFT_718285 [Gautieria morchelliformis]|nr:hypothetical protein JB92DRAFT_718285 [Gautieria morchelliformis]
MSSLSVPSRVAPGSRARSAGRPSREENSDRARSRSPLPSTPRMPSLKSTRPHTSRDNMQTNSSSTSSSASGSSFLDRMKAPSSRTSLEEDRPRRTGAAWASSRRKPAVQTEDGDSEGLPTEGYGDDLWSRVTTVAGTLSVNVSQAWKKSVLADGEETPPGEESRLTKAMKAYHLDRARSPADLPSWLFDEQERGVAPKAWNVSRNYEDRFMPDHDPEPRQRGGLREVYDRAAVSPSSTAPVARRPPADTGDGGGSRATNRLRAIRDAKRSMQTGSGSAPSSQSEAQLRDMTTSRVSEQSPDGSGETRRVGLPAGPGRRRGV